MPDLRAQVPTCTLKPSPTPEKTPRATRAMAANAAHLARLLQGAAYPPQS